MPNKAHLTIQAKSKNVGLARLTVATFASELDFNLNEIEEIKVAVSEAVTNSIIHGYPDRDDKIDIKMKIEEDELTVVVTDYGVGISDVEAVLQPSYTTKDQHMGLGLAFIDSFMDDFNLESEINGGTIVTMLKTPEKLKKVKD